MFSGVIMKAQGSLEYLIILAAVLAIGAIVVLFVTDAFSQTKTAASVENCRNALTKVYQEYKLHGSVAKDISDSCYEICKDFVYASSPATDFCDGEGLTEDIINHISQS
ncbi:hypothetical protein DRN74_01650 [Candidatus Micrarchaeota archaeon]|nr:MAG: hypothetical protein DRN74_01650 [Candidatus Micrarchaeota archaeon]